VPQTIPSDFDPKRFLTTLFNEALRGAAPAETLPAHLPPPPKGRTVVVGAGKAAAAMAKAVEDHWTGALEGLVITRYAHSVPCKRIEVIEAGHPMPDTAGQHAAMRILNLAKGLTADDLLICLISGGGSSLLSLPAPSISLADKQALNKQLLACGAAIDEINCVRKHISAIKGGRLAQAAAPARVAALCISDVPGDDFSVIASGPTAGDPTTAQDARAILDKYKIKAPDSVLAWLRADEAETPKPHDPIFKSVYHDMIARPEQSLQLAARIAHQYGITPVLLGDQIEGEAKDVAKAFAGIALATAKGIGPAKPPCVLISGGELTVTVRGNGKGGRNTEFCLALADSLKGHPNIYALACDTDGIDGVEDNAGAYVTPSTLQRHPDSPAPYLARNDSYTFFKAIDDLIFTGPTRTNVNDFRAILVLPSAAPQGFAPISADTEAKVKQELAGSSFTNIRV
jgi:hydroxypyruvate reductase